MPRCGADKRRRKKFTFWLSFSQEILHFYCENFEILRRKSPQPGTWELGEEEDRGVTEKDESINGFRVEK